VPGIELGTSGSIARNPDHRGGNAKIANMIKILLSIMDIFTKI
jgi:hypothetical protein